MARTRRPACLRWAALAFLAVLPFVQTAAEAQAFYSSRFSIELAAQPPRYIYRHPTLRTAPRLEEPMRIERGNPRPVVTGTRARVHRGMAYAPSAAPLSIKRAIWAANALRNKPYRWGGGHGSFSDVGHDCSGTVSYALHGAGVLHQPLDSRSLRKFGERGRGKWITIYTRDGHAFIVIAGLRLDTTGAFADEGPRWRADERSPRGFEARHPQGC